MTLGHLLGLNPNPRGTSSILGSMVVFSHDFNYGSLVVIQDLDVHVGRKSENNKRKVITRASRMTVQTRVVQNNETAELFRKVTFFSSTNFNGLFVFLFVWTGA